MFLKKLQLINFKNYTNSGIEFSEKINCFVGNNGVGKTNLLDAIYYLSFTKSYFSTIDSLNIRHGEDFFAVHGIYQRNGNLPEQVSVIQKLGSKKQFRLNQKDYSRLSDHIGQFPCVMVSPYDRDLINEGSDIRRKFIDSVISQFDKLYLDKLIRYHRLLDQRNVLLRQFAENHRVDREMVQLIDEQMAVPAAGIFEKRKQFLEGFLPIFSHYFGFISGGLEKVDIRYDSRLQDGSYSDLASGNLEKDLSARYSTVGVHKDDFLLEINGYPVKRYGSQGQQKSFAVALKLAQFDFTRSLIDYKPLILFDDIFDKLDPDRVQQIIDLVSKESFGQIFITDTEPERIRRSFESSRVNHKVFEINTTGIQFKY